MRSTLRPDTIVGLDPPYEEEQPPPVEYSAMTLAQRRQAEVLVDEIATIVALNVSWYARLMLDCSHSLCLQPADNEDSSSGEEEAEGAGALHFHDSVGLAASSHSVCSSGGHLTRRERQRRVPETVRRAQVAAGLVQVPRADTWEARTGALTVSKVVAKVSQEEAVPVSAPSSARSKGSSKAGSRKGLK